MRALNRFELEPRSIYTHRWRNGDLLIWDNRCVLHKVEPYDFLNERRVMRRCVILGEDMHDQQR